MEPTSPNPAPTPAATPSSSSSSASLSQTTTPPAPSISTPKPESKPKTNGLFTKWYFWTIVALAFVAIFGIALAAISMSDHAAAEDKISQLEKDLDEKNQLLVKYGAQLGQIVEDSSRPGYEGNKDDKDDKDDKPASAINTADYIYVGEWGIKFKIPKGMKNVSYTFENILGSNDDRDYTLIRVYGIPDALDYTPEFAQPFKNYWSLGTLARYEKGEIEKILASPPVKVYEDDNYEYGYSHPQAVYTFENEEEKQHELEAAKLVQQMLTDESNRSPF